MFISDISGYSSLLPTSSPLFPTIWSDRPGNRNRMCIPWLTYIHPLSGCTPWSLVNKSTQVTGSYCHWRSATYMIKRRRGNAFFWQKFTPSFTECHPYLPSVSTYPHASPVDIQNQLWMLVSLKMISCCSAVPKFCSALSASFLNSILTKQLPLLFPELEHSDLVTAFNSHLHLSLPSTMLTRTWTLIKYCKKKRLM